MIKKIEINDANSILELSKKVLICGEIYRYEFIIELCLNRMGYCYLYNNNIIGYLLYIKKNDKIIIAQICVEEKYQNKGICKILLEIFFKNTIGDIYLHVRKTNLKALHIYKKYGFEEIEEIENYYSYTSKNDNALYMNKNNEKKI